MSAYALKAYRSTDLHSRCEQSSKRDLVIMMYDGAIDAIRLAREYALRQEKRAASASSSRAMTILTALRETLDQLKQKLRVRRSGVSISLCLTHRRRVRRRRPWRDGFRQL